MPRVGLRFPARRTGSWEGSVPAQTVTLTAHAWGAVIRKLSVGEHKVVGDVLFANGEHGIGAHPLTVVPRHDG